MTIKVGIIGLGYWGPNLLRNFSELENSEVVSVCEINQERLKSISKQKRFKGIKTTSKLEEVLNDTNIDAVVIATPTKTHYDLALKSLQHNKHVLVEKPLTYSPEHSLELMKVAESKDLTLMVGHTFIFNSAVKKIKEEIESGNLGEVLYLHGTRTGLGPIRQDVGVIWDLAPHDISIFNYLLGELPKSVYSQGRIFVQKDKNVEDIAFLTFDYPNNVIAGVKASWLDPIKVRNLTVVGTKKMIVFDDTNTISKLVIYDKGANYQPKTGEFGDFQLSLRDGDIIIPKIKNNEPLQEECAHFLHCIETGEKPLTNGRNGYEVVAALSAAQESLKEGHKVEIKY